ncbi:MAG: hypothetical protein DRH79_05600 [Candidatus Cloacimonadota bacterium]|nr:MAG: hypothetical protein DRH79_05600 [Candidatus Cloacimonadota bacterium]
MKNKSRLLLGIGLFILTGVIISCTDSLDKTISYVESVRVEYSDCSGCQECMLDFSCPENAIMFDSTRTKAFIDADKCVQCMECINLFNCPDDAFTLVQDIIPPAALNGLNVYSDNPGDLTIKFQSTGDDDTLGNAYQYELQLLDENDEEMVTDFEPTIPINPGFEEYWIISDLEEDALITVNIRAYDEMNNASPVASAVVTIMGNHHPPAAINTLSISNVSSNSFQLNWFAVGNNGLSGGPAEYYIVKVHTDSITEENWNDIADYEQDMIPANPFTIENLQIEGLEISTEYFAAIKAVDDSSNIAPISVVVSATTLGAPDLTAPAAITDLSVDTIDMNSFVLNWTAVGDDSLEGTASSYIVKVNTEIIDENNWNDIPDFLQNLTPQPAGSEESLLITDLDPLTEYYAAVKALDEMNNIADISNLANATTSSLPDSTPPAAITDLTAIGSETEIELSWTSPGDDGNIGTAAGYEIRIALYEITEINWEEAELLPGPPWPLIAGSLQDYTVDELELGNVYYFAIKAFDENNNYADISNVTNSQLIEDIIPPSDITNLSVLVGYASNLTTIRINWTAPGDNGDIGICDHYEIRYLTQPIGEDNWATATLFNDPPAPLAAGANQFCNVTGLNSATIYYFAVKAFDEVGNVNNISNSPGGKIVFQINTGACHNCANCINDCDQNAIHQGAGYKYIDPDECTACGDCTCPWNLIYQAVVAY